MSTALEDLLTSAMAHEVEDVFLGEGLVRDTLRRHRRRQQRVRVTGAAATVAAAAAVVPLMGGSGGPRASVSGAEPSPTASPTPAGRDLTQFDADLVDSFLTGTGADATRGHRALYEILAVGGESRAQCLTAAGHPSTAPRISAYDESDPTQYPDLETFARTGEFTALSTGANSEGGLDPSLCSDDIGVQFPSITGWSNLSTSLLDEVTAIQASPPVLSALRGFRSCVVEAGVPTRNAGTFTGAHGNGSSEAVGDFIGAVTGEVPTTSPQQIVANEKHWMPVFLRCFAPVLAVQEPLEIQARDTFRAAHATEIAQLTQQTDAELLAAEATYGVPQP